MANILKLPFCHSQITKGITRFTKVRILAGLQCRWQERYCRANRPTLLPIRVCLLEESRRTPQKRPKKKPRYIPFTATARALLPSTSAPSLRSESVSLHSLTHQEPSLVLQPEAPLRGQEVKRGVDEKQEIFLHRD